MSEPKPAEQYKHGGKRKGAGRPSIDAKSGEPTKELTIRLSKSQYDYLLLAVKREDIPLAAYIRRLIKQDMLHNRELTRLSEEHVKYLTSEYKGVIAGIAALIEKDKGEHI